MIADTFFELDLFDILLVSVGSVALIVYWFQKVDQRRAAAILVKEQIDLIEERVQDLKGDSHLGDISVYNSKTILTDNSWDKYKHILIGHIQKSDATLIQKFYDEAEQIERARSGIIEAIMYSWEQSTSVICKAAGRAAWRAAKSITGPESEIEIVAEAQRQQRQQELFEMMYQDIDGDNHTPRLIVKALTRHLRDFVGLAGTTAYRRLQAIAHDRR